MVKEKQRGYGKMNAADRKEQYKQKQASLRKIMMGMFVIIVASVIVVAGILPQMKGSDSVTSNSKFETPIESNDFILIPLADLSENAEFYSYNSEGVDINYFAVIGEDDQVHVALDACDLCYSAKKGYEQIDDLMRCINCGRQFPITSIGIENTAGGCWPSYIPIDVDDEEVKIKVSDLEAKRFMCE